MKLLKFEQEANDLPAREIADWKFKFQSHPMRGILALEIHRLIAEQHKKFESITPDKLAEVQGWLKGLKQAHSLLLDRIS